MMNLSVNGTNCFNKVNYSKSPNFGNKTAYEITENLCRKIEKSFGNEYLFKLVGNQKKNALWSAINADTGKAENIVNEVLKAEESRGKSCQEIVDKIIEKLTPKEQESKKASDAIRSAVAPQINNGRFSYHSKSGKLALHIVKPFNSIQILSKLTDLSLSKEIINDFNGQSAEWRKIMIECFDNNIPIRLKVLDRRHGNLETVVKIPLEEAPKVIREFWTTGQKLEKNEDIREYLVALVDYLDQHPEKLPEATSPITDNSSYRRSLKQRVAESFRRYQESLRENL